MDAPSSFGNWDRLPATVVLSLYEYLPLKETLSVSSVCKQWRQIFLQSCPILWRVLTLDLQPEKAKWKKQLELHRVMCLKFFAFTRRLVVKWCICDVQSAVYFFTKLPQITTKIRSLGVRMRKCCKRCRQVIISSSDSTPLDLVKALETCIAQFAYLNNLLFGYCCDDNLFKILCNQCFENRTALTTLNISCAGSNNFRPTREMAYPGWLSQVQYLTMDWDMITGKYLNSLAETVRQGELRMKRLNIVISSKDSRTDMTSCRSEWTRLFDEMKSSDCKLTIGLVLIALETEFRLEQVEHVFHSSAPVEDVLVVYLVEDGTNPVENYKRMVRSLHNVRSLTVQGLEPDDQFPTDTAQGRAWIDLASDSELTKFSIFGVYLELDDVLRFLQRKADVDFSFTCSIYDIVQTGVVHDFLTPLASDRKTWKELERRMGKSRGCWQAVDKRPLQRVLKRKGERVEDIVVNVLREAEDLY